MKSKKSKKHIVLYVILCLIIVIVYFRVTAPPFYKGRLTLDINNTTSQKIEGAILEYESLGEKITLPDIKPHERIMIITPSGVGDKPMHTGLYLYYNNKKICILDEYHTLVDDPYNADVVQYAKAKILNGDIEYLSPYKLIDLNLKPYFRIIDMDKE